MDMNISNAYWRAPRSSRDDIHESGSLLLTPSLCDEYIIHVSPHGSSVMAVLPSMFHCLIDPLIRNVYFLDMEHCNIIQKIITTKNRRFSFQLGFSCCTKSHAFRIFAFPASGGFPGVLAISLHFGMKRTMACCFWHSFA
jgi:hypothetical protein